ncbi:hypothetical protein HQ590_12245, partial [bacterium]|nr:hypothetical protein [bacterium]
VLDIEKDVKRGQIGLMVKIKNVLTAEQQAKLREIKRQGRPGPRNRGPMSGPGGGPGGPPPQD